MFHEFRRHDGWRINHSRLFHFVRGRDGRGEIGMYLNESVPVKRHAVAFFRGCVLL